MSRTKVSDVELLAFIWGAIFAGGVFAAVAVLLLTPSSLILWEIVRGRFAGLVERAREEGRGR